MSEAFLSVLVDYAPMSFFVMWGGGFEVRAGRKFRPYVSADGGSSCRALAMAFFMRVTLHESVIYDVVPLFRCLDRGELFVWSPGL